MLLNWLTGLFVDRPKYGPWEGHVILGCVRNTGAPAIWNVAEPCGGMAESGDLVLERVREIVEIGLYNETGWAQFSAIGLTKTQQDALIEEQARWWQVVEPQLSCAPTALMLYHSRVGEDTLDGQPGLISVGEVGDLQHLSFACLSTSAGNGYRVRDLECHFDGEKWQPLNRKVVAIAERSGRSPLIFEFGPDGLLDECGLHLALSGEALENNTSELFRGLLGPRGLDWLVRE